MDKMTQRQNIEDTETIVFRADEFLFLVVGFLLQRDGNNRLPDLLETLYFINVPPSFIWVIGKWFVCWKTMLFCIICKL